MCSFCIACERNYAPKGSDRETDFFTIVAWRNTADFVEKFFQKGKEILVNGTLETRKYQDKEGAQRIAYEIKAENVYFSGSKSDNATNQLATAPAERATTPEEMTNVDMTTEDELPF